MGCKPCFVRIHVRFTYVNVCLPWAYSAFFHQNRAVWPSDTKWWSICSYCLPLHKYFILGVVILKGTSHLVASYCDNRVCNYQCDTEFHLNMLIQADSNLLLDCWQVAWFLYFLIWAKYLPCQNKLGVPDPEWLQPSFETPFPSCQIAPGQGQGSLQPQNGVSQNDQKLCKEEIRPI